MRNHARRQMYWMSRICLRLLCQDWTICLILTIENSHEQKCMCAMHNSCHWFAQLSCPVATGSWEWRKQQISWTSANSASMCLKDSSEGTRLTVRMVALSFSMKTFWRSIKYCNYEWNTEQTWWLITTTCIIFVILEENKLKTDFTEVNVIYLLELQPFTLKLGISGAEDILYVMIWPQYNTLESIQWIQILAQFFKGGNDEWNKWQI